MNRIPVGPIARRLAALDWTAMGDSLDRLGYATTGPLLSAEECAGLVALYGEAGRFRSRVIMQRHGFGRGEYQYFAYPLPALVGQLRRAVYPHLAPVARRWNGLLGHEAEVPGTLDEYLARCHAAGQARPTALLLKYGADDFNCLPPGPLRPAGLPAAAHHPAEPAGRRFHRWRVPAGRAAAAGPVARRGRAAGPGRGGDLRRQPPPGAGHPRALPGGAAPWREPATVGRALQPRGDPARRRLTAAPQAPPRRKMLAG